MNGYYNYHCFPLTSSPLMVGINKYIFMQSFNKFQSSYKLCGIILNLHEHNVVAIATPIILKWIGIWFPPCGMCLLLFALINSSIWGFEGVVNYENRNFVKKHDLENITIDWFDPSQLCIKITKVIYTLFTTFILKYLVYGWLFNYPYKL